MKRQPPKETSYLYDASPEDQERLVELVAELFEGNKKIHEQKIIRGEQNYYPLRYWIPWKEIVYQHLAHNRTFGINPIMSNKMVQIMCLDVDAHSKEQGYASLGDMASLTVKYCPVHNQMGETLLLEWSGRGAHIWMRSAVPLPAQESIRFLRAFVEGIKRGDTPAFHTKPESEKNFGGVIRLPFGFHKLIEKKSYCLGLDKQSGVPEIQQVISKLENWQLLSYEDIRSVIPDFDVRRYGGTMPPQRGIPDKLEQVARAEKKDCVKYILTHTTPEGFRHKTARCLAIHFSKFRGMRAQEIWDIMWLWKQFLCDPGNHQFTTDEFKKGVQYGLDYNKPNNCAHDHIMGTICSENKLREKCPSSKENRGLPVKDIDVHHLLDDKIKIGNKMAMLIKAVIYLSERGNTTGWFRVTSADLAEAMGITKDSFNRRIRTGKYNGSSYLEVLKGAGILDFRKPENKGSKFIDIILKENHEEKVKTFLKTA